MHERVYAPSVLQEWAELMLNHTAVRSDQRVLDVLCATGILARAARNRLGDGSGVVGVDPEADMLNVARSEAPGIDWRLAPSEDLPFEDAAFDVALSMFGLTRATDPVRTLQEMHRVLRPGGRLSVSVWDSLEEFAIYDELARVLRRRFPADVVEPFVAAYRLGSRGKIIDLFGKAGLGTPSVERHAATARFPSLREWLRLEIASLGPDLELGEAEFEELVDEARARMRSFVNVTGTVASPAPGYLASIRKR